MTYSGSTRFNHVIAFLLVALAMTTGVEARRNHHTNPLEQLVQNYYSSTDKAPIDLLWDEDDSRPAPISKRHSQLLNEKPVVKKFMHNIYSEEFYSKSAMKDYVDSFYTGYQFSDYQFAGECKANMTNFLDTFHTFSGNITETLVKEQQIGQYLLVS